MDGSAMRLFGTAGAWQGQDRLGPAARRAIQRAGVEGAARGLAQATPDILLAALLAEPDGMARHALAAAGVDIEGLGHALAGAATAHGMPHEEPVPLDAAAREAVVLGMNEARRAGFEQAGGGHLLLGVIEAGSGAGVRYLRRGGLDLRALRELVDVAESSDGGRAVEHFAAAFTRLLDAIGGAADCPRCGAPLHDSFTFCYHCGGRLHGDPA
jgi:ATP-dependent Clp protease ATP-binding subunit ClpA